MSSRGHCMVFPVGKMDTLAANMKMKYPTVGSPILKSIDPNINNRTLPSRNNASGDTSVCGTTEGLISLNLSDDEYEGSKSVFLLDDSEQLLMKSEGSFLKALNIKPSEKVKVVSIFGNTGEGKSYTLNKVFFNGEEVFRTSPSQTSCTLGVWAMYNPELKVICLDTEGLLGISKRENQRTRMLLKVLAVSDIIIYRTRAERLQRDMYTFLGSASKAYKDHFSSALKSALAKNDAEKFSSAIGPGVVIFHETRYTDTLHDSANVKQSAEDILQTTFAELGLPFDAFSFLKYVGVKTTQSETSFKELKNVLVDKLESTEVRTKRDAKYIFLTLQSLNEKFKNNISGPSPQLYLPAFFTCTEKCQSCKSTCSLSMGHKEEGEPHRSDQDCTYQHQYQNHVYLCRACYNNGQRISVKPNYQTMNDNSWSGYFTYVWSGYVIECPKCGEIYRSRQHWYGNKNPEESAVRTEIVHLWPGDYSYYQERSLLGSQNSAQKVLDSVTMFTDAISSVGSQPKQLISDWAADKIAPSYWRPNHEIKECSKCGSKFQPTDKKHHCRACGEGFCENCSSKRQPVPSRGWYEDVRVCDFCYMDQPPSISTAVDGTENRARQLGETVINSISVVKSTVFDIPKDFIKESARPSYWVPDADCIECAVCFESFGFLQPLHHCRDCGKGVCDECSKSRKPVPLRGWEKPVRVCNNCR
ncbi:zinc finger FYVE domain-containing protein 1 isoform X3 [Leptinotarsa decemlineata]|uniref:zinc finger FYVE domain-containing protein 1 isoform X3 n=1 Tax=Leptinotarsa decemlineata TaxID=7539 RepID=UPI003D30AB50